MNRTYHIAIVEDSAIVAEMLSWQLCLNANYNVSLYQCGEELLRSEPSNIDILIVDYFLSGEGKGVMTGAELIKKLPEIPFVVLSGQGDTQIALDLLAMGAFEYIKKDDEAFDKVIEAIGQIIRSWENNSSLAKEPKPIG